MKRIIFFDGVCNLCNVFISTLVKLDSEQKFYYASLQGITGQKMLINTFSDLKPKNQSVIYQDILGKKYSKSDAVIFILRDLHSLGYIFLLFKVIPKFIRDFIYSFIATNRYKLFGKQDTCRLPSNQERERFLD